MDYQAVTGAANHRGIPGSWAEVLRSWFIANALNRPSGLYGYRGEISLAPLRVWNPGSPSIFPLNPGEGTYVSLPSPFDPLTPSQISYAGLTLGSETADTSAPYTGNYLLVLNTDGNVKGELIPAPIPTSSVAASYQRLAPAPRSSSAGGKSSAEAGSWPVDFLFPLSGREEASPEKARDGIKGTFLVDGVDR